MKRIVLGISVLLMLVQNGFSRTDVEYDKIISDQTTEVWKQIWRCNKATMNHLSTANVNICLKAVKLEKKNNFKEEEIKITYLNIGVMYDNQGDKLNAYKYYMKSAKLGNTRAQQNLSIMCKQDPWACK